MGFSDFGFMEALISVVYRYVEHNLPKRRPFTLLILFGFSSDILAAFEGQITQ